MRPQVGLARKRRSGGCTIVWPPLPPPRSSYQYRPVQKNTFDNASKKHADPTQRGGSAVNAARTGTPAGAEGFFASPAPRSCRRSKAVEGNAGTASSNAGQGSSIGPRPRCGRRRWRASRWARGFVPPAPRVAFLSAARGAGPPCRWTRNGRDGTGPHVHSRVRQRAYRRSHHGWNSWRPLL